MKFKRFIFTAVLFFPIVVSAQKSDPPFMEYINHPWVDSVMKILSPEERAGQLIWVAGFANGDLGHEAWLNSQITAKGIGGIIFFRGDAVREAQMINYYRKVSKVPLIFASDGEYGLGMRLEGVQKFPYQLTLGAIRNDSLIYLMGRSVAEQFKKAGININLAPVADVNNNPDNPVINVRSFGEDPANVAAKTSMYMHGLQNLGVVAVGKHFPGHGDTEIDSHLDLPVIRHSMERLDSTELVPFRALINEGVSCIMPGHLNVLSVDSTRNLPATLSEKVLTGLLKEKMGFRGLVLSDAMNMGGITNFSRPGDAEVKALKAGIDVLEYVTDPALAVKTIMESIKKGYLPASLIDEKCRKVLALKYWSGLTFRDTVNTENPEKELSSPEMKEVTRELYANALTLLENNQNIIPLRNLNGKKIAAVAVNKKTGTQFLSRISKYWPSDCYSVNTTDSKAVATLLQKLSGYDLVIAGIYGVDSRSPLDPALSEGIDNFIGDLTRNNPRTVIAWFGNPYLMTPVKNLANASALLLSYQENDLTEDLSAQLIFGALGARGMLPVTINENWKYGHGILTPGNLRMQYGLPESAGISSGLLDHKIDSIANAGLEKKAFPGCEVIIARKGIVVFSKTYGFQTFDDRTPISEDDLFDLASVTKVSSTLPGLMLLDSKGKFSTDKTLGEYVQFYNGSDKGSLKMIDILTHQAGLVAWIPFWKETIKKNGNYNQRIYHPVYSPKYPLEVAPGLFIKENYRDKMLKEIKKSKLGEKKYLYSDNGLIVSTDIIANLTGEKWYQFVYDSIYHKIGAYDITFNPMQKYPLDRIVPTEYDSLYRKQLIWGTVHDEGAAMQGGISGHAGLFATGNDLMKLMELYRRMGNYGGEQIISRDVLERYSSVQFPDNNNKRGIGFDKPSLNNSTLSREQAYPARSVSPESFGHSGFTGTFVWIDPKYEISYVFLSNRVYPTRNNNLISELSIRGSILQAVYDSIIK